MVKKGNGFSLLEILFSMVLFIVVIASFAMVFPSGYHLNLKSYRQNQGVDLANAILQEVVSKPFESPPGGPGTGDSLQNLQNWTGECESNNLPQTGCSTSGDWTPQALYDFYRNNPGLAKEYQYRLPSASGNTPAGIEVSFLSPPLGSAGDNPIVQVTVNLQWKENQNENSVTHTITLKTFATYDRD